MNKGKWYAIHVFSQSEQKVKTLLEKTAVKKNVDDKIFEIVIPLDTEVKKKDGKKVEDFAACDPYQLMADSFAKKIRGQDAWLLPLEESVKFSEFFDSVFATLKK